MKILFIILSFLCGIWGFLGTIILTKEFNSGNKSPFLAVASWIFSILFIFSQIDDSGDMLKFFGGLIFLFFLGLII